LKDEVRWFDVAQIIVSNGRKSIVFALFDATVERHSVAARRWKHAWFLGTAGHGVPALQFEFFELLAFFAVF
jgi:hypothetical protein